MLTSLQSLLRLASLRWLGVFICALATLLTAAGTAYALERAPAFHNTEEASRLASLCSVRVSSRENQAGLRFRYDLAETKCPAKRAMVSSLAGAGAGATECRRLSPGLPVRPPAARYVDDARYQTQPELESASPRGPPIAARAAPIVGRSLGAAADITITSGIKNSSYATRLAQGLGQQAQRDVDNLLGALRAGNTNPGIGTRALGGGFFELRGANAGRVIVHQGSANQFTIAGKFQGHVRGDTANSAIIQRLIAESGL